MFWLAACVHPAARIPAPVADGGELRADGPVTLRVVGGPLPPGPAPDGVVTVVLGDAVEKGTRRAWAGVAAAVDGPTLFVPGRGEHTADPELASFYAAVDGLGVTGLEAPVPWRAFDVTTGGVRWRIVLADAHADVLGTRWRDQLSWLPKVARGGPVVLLASTAWVTPGPIALAETAERTADPLVAVVVPGVSSVLEPDGRWGTAWLTVGRETTLAFDGDVLTARVPGLPDLTWSAASGWAWVPP